MQLPIKTKDTLVVISESRSSCNLEGSGIARLRSLSLDFKGLLQYQSAVAVPKADSLPQR